MNYVLIPIVGMLLASSTYIAVSQSDKSHSTEWMVPVVRLEPETVDAILNPGLEEVQHAIKLRSQFEESGFDYENAPHIPEFEIQFHKLATYYREAVKVQKELSSNLEKVLAQMKSVLKNEAMSLHKWKLFHTQLGALFSPQEFISKNLARYGKLEFGQTSASPFNQEHGYRKGFVWFVYEHEGLLGLKALNLAFVEGITVLPMPTQLLVWADGRPYFVRDFTDHDAEHASVFNRSAYAFHRFKEPLKTTYNKIENQRDDVERVRDHVILFMFIHEFLTFADSYYEELSELFHQSYQKLLKGLSYRFGISKDPVKNLIFNEVRFALTNDPIRINQLTENTYEIVRAPLGRPIEKYHAKLVGKGEGFEIETNVPSDSGPVNFDTKNIQYADFDSVLKLLLPKEQYKPLNVVGALRRFGQSFLSKYALSESV